MVKKVPDEDYYDLTKTKGCKWIGETIPAIVNETTKWICPCGRPRSTSFANIKKGQGTCVKCKRTRGRIGVAENGRKLCGHCKETKFTDAFWRQRNSVDGFCYRCKDCQLDIRRGLHKMKTAREIEEKLWRIARYGGKRNRPVAFVTPISESVGAASKVSLQKYIIRWIKEVVEANGAHLETVSECQFLLGLSGQMALLDLQTRNGRYPSAKLEHIVKPVKPEDYFRLSNLRWRPNYLAETDDAAKDKTCAVGNITGMP